MSGRVDLGPGLWEGRPKKGVDGVDDLELRKNWSCSFFFMTCGIILSSKNYIYIHITYQSILKNSDFRLKRRGSALGQ